MRLSPGYAKLTQKNIVDLNRASECIAGVASTIQSVKPQWGPGVLTLLIEANNIVVGIQTRGAECIARYLERHGVGRSPEAAEAPAAAPETALEPPIEPQPE